MIFVYTNVILELDFQSQHESVTLKFGGVQKQLIISGLATLKNQTAKSVSKLHRKQ